MNEVNQETVQKDRFWLYVGFTLVVILTGIFMVKQSENDKYEPIKQQIENETALMNIRVLN
jgi:cytochrome b subunit of formate dehydrogenase